MKKHNSVALSYNDKALNELHDAKAILNALNAYCLNKEFTGEYYGIPQDYIQMLSNERNEYTSLMVIAIEKILNIRHILLGIEQELSLLQKNADNSSRQVTTQSTTNQSS